MRPSAPRTSLIPNGRAESSERRKLRPMRFALFIPASEAAVDESDEVNAGFTRHGVVALLDRLRGVRNWPYEILENLPQTERDRFYHQEAEPAARAEEVSIEGVFGFDGQSAPRFGSAVPALVAYTAGGQPVAVYPNHTRDGRARPIIPYLGQLLGDMS